MHEFIYSVMEVPIERPLGSHSLLTPGQHHYPEIFMIVGISVYVSIYCVYIIHCKETHAQIIVYYFHNVPF